VEPACVNGGAHEDKRAAVHSPIQHVCQVRLLSVLLVSQVTMGRGDKRTAKGKRKAQSHGNSRPSNGARRRAAAAKKAEAPASE